MQKSYDSLHLKHTDLDIYSCGFHDCDPGYGFGPAIRNHFLIHYIIEGSGTFKVGPKTYHLKKGDGFLICPDVLTYYEADSKDPWTYSFVGFRGVKAEPYLKQSGLTQDTPIFTYTKDSLLKDTLLDMVYSGDSSFNYEIKQTGLLYTFLYHLIDNAGLPLNHDGEIKGKELYVHKAVEYIEKNYSRKIKIQQIADYICIDRCYLHALFKKYMSESPQSFLINYRLDKACNLLKRTDLAVGDISRSVGYDDTLLFSRTFKKIKKVSPSQYRSIKNNNL